MNSNFSQFFEFKTESSIFLSKAQYLGYLKHNGPQVHFYYSIHPEIFSIIDRETLIFKIKEISRNLYEKNYYKDLSAFEKFLLMTGDSEFMPNLISGLYDENISSEYVNLLSKNHLSENEGYFSIKNGFLIFNPNSNNVVGYNLKWTGAINTPRFEKPDIITLKKYLEKETFEIKNCYFNFEKQVESVDKKEIFEVFYNVSNYFKSLKVYLNCSERLFENFAYTLTYPLYYKYHVNGLLPSFVEQNLSDILNPEVKKPIIH